MLMGKRLHCFLAHFFLKSKVLTLCRARLSTVSPYTRTLLCLFCASAVLFHDLLSLSGAAGVSPERWLGSAMGWRAENAPWLWISWLSGVLPLGRCLFHDSSETCALPVYCFYSEMFIDLWGFCWLSKISPVQEMLSILNRKRFELPFVRRA